MAPKSRRVPPEQRQRTERSCDRCKTRKQKCKIKKDQDPCEYCQNKGFSCVFTTPRKQRLTPQDINSDWPRIAALESFIVATIPDVDVSSLENLQEMTSSLGLPTSIADASVNAAAKVVESEEFDHDPYAPEQHIVHLESKIRTFLGMQSIGQICLVVPNLFLGSGPEGALDINSITIMLSPFTSHEPTHTINTIVYRLIRTFFDRVNIDFPVLDEVTFYHSLYAWAQEPEKADPTWVCSLLCVLILAGRFGDPYIPYASEYEEILWRQIQSLLTRVVFTSSLTSIQTLMLAALYLHNTDSRAACWTFTGTAIRIGYAIGLHRDRIAEIESPVREMRNTIWWTLYSFEQMQISFQNRPSAMTARIGIESSPKHMIWSNRLALKLDSACRLLSERPSHAFLRLRLQQLEVRRLPKLPEDLSAMPLSSQRSLLLIHIQNHYIICLMAQYALISRLKDPSGDSEALVFISDTFLASSRVACELLFWLDNTGNFNAVTWYDVYYLYSFALVLVLSIIHDIDQRRYIVDTIRLLNRCAGLAAKHLSNPMVPGTMRCWLTGIVEFYTKLMTDVPEFRPSKSYNSKA